MHVLIIDDNEVSIEVLQEMLIAMGATYVTLKHGDELHQINDINNTFDIIFLDIKLPRLNGYEILRILKDDYAVQVPVVAHSVYNSELEIARVNGFDSFLGKPLAIDHFREQIERILDGEQLWEVM